MRRFVASVLVLVAAALPAHANPWTLTTEYSADVVITAGGQTIASRINRTPNAMRAETQQRGQNWIAILRIDRSLGWLLVPGTRNAAETDLSAFPFAVQVLRDPGRSATVTAEGTETIDGMTATRWRVAGGEPGARFAGKVWATAEGVVLKIEGEAETAQQRQPFTLVARNVRIARQNPGLFEIPDGYTRLQVPPALLQALLSGQIR